MPILPWLSCSSLHLSSYVCHIPLTLAIFLLQALFQIPRLKFFVHEHEYDLILYPTKSDNPGSTQKYYTTLT